MAHGLEAEYHVVVSSRTPAQSAPPSIVEIGEVDPVGSISYADEINYGGEASFSLEPDKIQDDIATRLKDLKVTPCECTIYREGNTMWRGPLLSCQLQGPTLTINARGIWYYSRYMALETDLLFPSATDQYTIGKALVDAYQALDYGDYGIDTSGIGLSGITRTRNYKFAENHNVFKRVVELAELSDGFDVWVNPINRELNFAAQKGVDKTQSVFADEANVIDPAVFWSVADDDIASEGIAVGTSDDQLYVVGTASNIVLRQSWGRATVVKTADGVTTQTTADRHAQKIIDSRAEQLFVPGPAVVPIKDVEPTDFETGDLVTYAVEVGSLGILTTERRIRMRRVSVDEDGVESMTWELV